MEPIEPKPETNNATENEDNKSFDWSLKSMVFYFQKASWYHRTYLLDIFVGIVLWIIAFAVFNGAVAPFQRYLPPDDATVAFPTRNDTVPTWALGVLDITPIIIIGIVLYFRRSVHDTHHALLGLFIGLALTSVITNVSKTYAGRYRPDWLSTFAALDIADGRMSFPSGHSSNSFTAMTYLVLYLCGKVKLFSNKTTSSFATHIAVFSPLIVCTFIAISRTRDYKHNFTDILAGALIGIFAAFWAYFTYYPTLSYADCDKPKTHPSLIKGSEESKHLQREEVEFSPV